MIYRHESTLAMAIYLRFHPCKWLLPTSTITFKKRWRRESNPCARLCRPLPHHSATPPRGLMRLHLRADDGIRTRDPHLGKVMRYQLRYIRASRARCRHVRTETIVHPSMATQISLRLSKSPIAQRILAETAARARVRPRSPAGSWLGARSRGSVGERPLHTRKVAGSIPAGTTDNLRRSQAFQYSDFRSVARSAPGLSAVYPQSRSAAEPVECIRHTIEV
jgi:hypothetical protein